MRPCSWAGPQCPHAAVVTVRLAGIGDRSICQEHHDWAVRMGMDLRVLPVNAYVPAWRQRSLGRDLTGRVLNAVTR